jgi:hypothetical protein
MREVGPRGFSSFASKWKIDNAKTTKTGTHKSAFVNPGVDGANKIKKKNL